MGHLVADARHRRHPGHDDRPGRRHRLRPVPDHATSGAARGRHADRGVDRQAVATSGSAIVFAGGTVVVALVSLRVAGIPLLSTLGLASAIAVVTAVLAAITFLPAVLGLLGHRIHWLSLPAFMRQQERRRRSVGHVGRLRRPAPGLVAVVALVFLAPLIVPAPSLAVRSGGHRRDATRHHRAAGLRPDHRRVRRRLQRTAPGRVEAGPAGRAPATSTPRSTTRRRPCRSSWRRPRSSCPRSRSSSRRSRSSSRRSSGSSSAAGAARGGAGVAASTSRPTCSAQADQLEAKGRSSRASRRRWSAGTAARRPRRPSC